MMADTSLHARSLATMLADIDQAIGLEGETCPSAVAQAIQRHLSQPDLLAGFSCPSCPKGYIRHLLHADARGRYAVVALVWRPGQMSPVHAHKTWCALGVYRGTLSEAFYGLAGDNAAPRQTKAVLRGQGDTSFGRANLDVIHRLANLDASEAVSIHVYGASFDRFGQDVNHLF